MNHLLPRAFFQWCIQTPLAKAISQSMWGFAMLETVHIIGLTMLLGSIFVVNLTVLGVGMRRPAALLARELAPWGLGGFILMIASGVPMFMSAAMTYSGSVPFAIKMSLLVSAIAVQLSIHKIAGMYDGSAAGKLAACVSLLCWFGVAYAGRGIAFEVLFGTGA